MTNLNAKLDAKAKSQSMMKTKVLRRLRSKKFWIGTFLGIAKFVFIVGICFTILYPFLTKFSMSLMDQRDLFDRSVKSIPNNLRLDNYKEAIQYISFWNSLFNSTWMSTMSAVLQMFVCTFVGYGFAKYNFKGSKILFLCVIVAMVIPSQITITPLYLNLKSFDLFGLLPQNALVGNPAVFVLLSITGTAPKCGLYIFLARQFFKGVPKEIEEAASIDGAGHMYIFFRFMLQAASPILITIFLFAFVWAYNDFIYTAMFYSNLESISRSLYGLGHRLVTVGMEASATASNFGYLAIMNATSTLLAIAPLVVLYLLLQKRFVQSIERAGLVG